MEITNRFATYLTAGLIFLMPLFFLPILPIPVAFAKTSLVVVASLLAFLLVVVNYLKVGKIEFGKSTALLALGLVFLTYLSSTIFSGSWRMSLFGYGHEVDTFLTIGSLCLLMFATSVSFKDKNQIFYSYFAYLVSFVLLCAYQAVRLFAPADFLSFGIFFGKTANLVGKWSDLGVLAGLSLVISLASLELLKLTKPFRVFLYFTSILALLYMTLVNLKVVWVMAALVSLLFFIYNLSKNYRKKSESDRHISKPALIIMLISFIFIIGGGDISNYISTKLNLSNIEARPSWQSTYEVAKASVFKDPVLGVGPSRFSSAWVSSKPAAVNNSVFWSTDFNFGVGFLPSLVVTVGILGFLAWLAFLVLVFLDGFRSLFKKEHDGGWDFFVFSSLMASLYLWGLAIFYPPNVVVLALAFISTGILIASARSSGGLQTVSINFSALPKMSFISVLALVIVAVIGATGIYASAQNIVSQYKYQKGIILSATDIVSAEQEIAKAAAISEKDLYLRALVEAELAKMAILAKREDLSPEIAQSEFQNILTAAVSFGRAAIEKDPSNYNNWLTLGKVYETIVPFKVEGAYAEAQKIYSEALARNPKNPAIFLVMARLEAVSGNNAAAKENIGKALSIKNNYTDAVFLLSQIEVSEGNIKEAIKSVEAAGLIAPNDPVVFFQLGLLRYSDKNFAGAAGAFERAVILNPTYSNAKYFLGLSYYELGRRSDALVQFEDVLYLNPENAEVKLILANLKAGKAPLTNALPPLDEEPSERDELPIEE